MLKRSQFTLDISFFVRHKNFFHPKMGNLQEVSQESVHFYSANVRQKNTANGGLEPNFTDIAQPTIVHSSNNGMLISQYD